MRRLESAQNPEVKAVAALKERRARAREGRFLVEGAREISRAIKGRVRLERVYVCPDLLGDEGRALLDPDPEGARRASPLREVAQVEVSSSAFAKMSVRENPDGLLAVAFPLERTLENLHLPENPLVFVLEGLEKPGNVGALLRTADGAGVDAVLIAGNTDLENPNTIRASQGSVFTVPTFSVTLEKLDGFLRVHRLALVAATPHATREYWDADLAGGVAVALGTENEGLSSALLERAGVQVRIPMRGAADSLNVGIAGALLLYEALRQRSRG